VAKWLLVPVELATNRKGIRRDPSRFGLDLQAEEKPTVKERAGKRL
jgi:hypothetical protein